MLDRIYKSPHAGPQQVCAADEFSELLEIPRDAMISRASCPTIKGCSNPTATASNSNKRRNKSSATMKRKLIRCSGWPVNFCRSSGSCFPALATRWQAHILVQILKYIILNIYVQTACAHILCSFQMRLFHSRKLNQQTHTNILGPRYCTKANKKTRVPGKAGSNSPLWSWVATPTGHVFKWHFPGQGGKSGKELLRTSIQLHCCSQSRFSSKIFQASHHDASQGDQWSRCHCNLLAGTASELSEARWSKMIPRSSKVFDSWPCYKC